MKWAKTWLLLAFGLLLAIILFFTFRGSSNVSDLSWMPERWGLWLDEHDEFRHFIGFAVFAALGFALDLDAVFTKSRFRFLRRFKPSRNRTGRLGAFLVFVYLLELGQIGMPQRDFDWMDIVNGWGGILLAWSIWFAIKSTQRRRRHRAHERRRSPINVSSIPFR